MRFRKLTFAGGLALALMAVPAYIARADTSITSSNQSKDSETKTGDASSSNSSAGFVGQKSGGGSTDVNSSDVNAATGSNVQEGDNDFQARQRSNATSGAAVGGQIVAGVSEGDLTIDATNLTASSNAQSGDADAVNSSAAFVGLAFGSSTSIGTADLTLASGALNAQEGDNSGDVDQVQNASSGDAITGQIVAGVTSAGGTADIAQANTSTDSSSTSGDSSEHGSSALFVGLDVSTETTIV
jgi:hypothetical protein